jgi:DNA-directed RNA polymerase subunit M/transcription elongation factor TFIIS
MGIEVSAFIECTGCRHRWEVPFAWDGSDWRTPDAASLDRCPRCGSSEVRNVSSEAGGEMSER